MPEPKISIIIPIYNAEHTIEKCVTSISNQTYSNLEIILVNDGSQDRSLEIICKLSQNDDRIIVIDKMNSGVSDTRNTGILAATGDFIAFVDSDDFIDAKLYESLVRCAMLQQTELVTLLNYTILPNEIPVDIDSLSSKKAQQELLRLRFPTSCWAYLYSKNIIKNIFFDKKIGFFEDLLFNFNVLQMASMVGLCRKDMYHYVINEGSINQSPLNEKKLSALDINFEITDNTKNLYDAETFFKAHMIISLVLSAMKNKNNEIQNIIRLQQASKNLLKRNRMFSNVPLHYILIIILTYLSPKFAIRLGKPIYVKYKGGKND